MTDHIGLDVIAALGEGLLDPREAGKARLHLRNCPVCTARAAALAEVPAALRRIAEAEPPPVPAWVSERLEAAFTAEVAAARTPAAAASDRMAAAVASETTAPAGALEEAATAAQDPASPAGTPPDHVPSVADARRRQRLAGRGRGSRVLRPLAAAAAICLLGGAGYGLFRAAEQPPSTASSAAAPRASVSSVTTPERRDGPLARPRGTPSGISSPQLVRSGTNYQPGQLQAGVESVLRQTAGARHNPPSAGSQHGTELPAGLEGCVQRIIGAQQPTLVDEASYRGQPAIVIVTPQPNGPGGQVWVAGAGCSAANSDVLAQTSISSIP